jgi:hypothetical protein
VSSGRKSSVKSSGRVKQPQPHGGALVPGAGGGRQPGAGRPPSAIRAAAREQLDKRLPLLGTFAGSAKVKTGDRIRAIEALAKIGLEESIAVADVRKALDATGELIRARLAPAVADSLIDEIRTIWLKL